LPGAGHLVVDQPPVVLLEAADERHRVLEPARAQHSLFLHGDEAVVDLTIVLPDLEHAKNGNAYRQDGPICQDQHRSGEDRLHRCDEAQAGHPQLCDSQHGGPPIADIESSATILEKDSIGRDLPATNPFTLSENRKE
jgi:hypothetical protein